MEKENENEENSFVCPSFSTYSTDKLADIADQVTRDHLHSQNDIDFGQNDDDSDFEFVAFRKAADGVFLEGCAGPVFPIFNGDIAEGNSGAEEILFPLKKLSIGEDVEPRRSLSDAQSSSSSEVEDDLEAVPPGTYCVWRPKPVEESPSRCKKSNSTGSTSSKRWKLLEFLRRSNSEGKDSYVFLTPSKTTSSGSNSAKKKDKAIAKSNSKTEKLKEPRVTGKKISGVGGRKNEAASAHEAFYMRKREIQRRSYLPYRQDLVGFFSTLNGMGRTFPPF